MRSRALSQHYPRPGWVAHDPGRYGHGLTWRWSIKDFQAAG